MNKPKAVYLLSDLHFDRIYGPDEQDAIAQLVDIRQTHWAEDDELAEAEIIFSGWGSPILDQELLARMPKLKAFFYGAGSVKYLVKPVVWERGILVTSSYVANGLPVAEFTFAQIILSLKMVRQFERDFREHKSLVRHFEAPGAYYGTKVGIISLGAIGRLMCDLLKQLDVDVFAYDPFVSEEEMRGLGARKASLEGLFEQCDVVSLHAPLLDVTRGMIKESHFRSMLEGATFINTSRGAVVDEPAMVKVLQERPDITAVIDVTDPEPSKADSPLYTLPNVQLTPHIAGSMGRECHRMGRLAMEECRRFLKGEPPLHPITKDNIDRLA